MGAIVSPRFAARNPRSAVACGASGWANVGIREPASAARAGAPMGATSAASAPAPMAAAVPLDLARPRKGREEAERVEPLGRAMASVVSAPNWPGAACVVVVVEPQSIPDAGADAAGKPVAPTDAPPSTDGPRMGASSAPEARPPMAERAGRPDPWSNGRNPSAISTAGEKVRWLSSSNHAGSGVLPNHVPDTPASKKKDLPPNKASVAVCRESAPATRVL